ncbi:MAG: DUF262 domain-containing protein, partial [Streptosporangiaceae bacterium]
PLRHSRLTIRPQSSLSADHPAAAGSQHGPSPEPPNTLIYMALGQGAISPTAASRVREKSCEFSGRLSPFRLVVAGIAAASAILRRKKGSRHSIWKMSKAEAKVHELVTMVERGELQLPEMQRRYVWRSTRVRDLLDSLYRGWPSGAILLLETDEPVPL